MWFIGQQLKYWTNVVGQTDLSRIVTYKKPFFEEVFCGKSWYQQNMAKTYKSKVEHLKKDKKDIRHKMKIE
jgi:3-methyladenine DNA glycosylase Tag